jgi:hypothetical protein
MSLLLTLARIVAEREPERRQALRRQPPRIRCPRCQWQHDGEPHWICDACAAVFDTFLTGAACPSCPQCWTFTQCPRCDELSPHDDWYVRE